MKIKIIRNIFLFGSLLNFFGFVFCLGFYNLVFAVIWFFVAIAITAYIVDSKMFPNDCRRCKYFKSIRPNIYKCEKDIPPCLKRRF